MIPYDALEAAGKLFPQDPYDPDDPQDDLPEQASAFRRYMGLGLFRQRGRRKGASDASPASL